MTLLREIFTGFLANPVRDAVAGRILAEQNTRARRTAHAARGVTLRETHSALGERINVRRRVKRAAFRAHVLDAVIIHEDEENVGFGGSFGVNHRGQPTQPATEKIT